MRLLLLCVAVALSASAETITLKQAVDLALRQSPELRVAQAEQESAHQAFRQARSRFSG